MTSRRRLLAITVALALATAASARAGDTYDVSGNDTYQIGNNAQPTVISYSGTQDLAVARSNQDHRFVCDARYTRTDGTSKVTMHARFVQEMERDGSFDDMSDEDPDFLTILNQPFAIELDPHTLRDVRTLRGEVPFEATSPLGGARLTGMLRPAQPGVVRGHPVVGVHFSANGPMTGTLPEHADAKLEGTIHMDGTAYYAENQALLLALDATLTIAGQLGNNNATVPVRITYHRVIRTSTKGTLASRL
jgi:hypothetical protein